MILTSWYKKKVTSFFVLSALSAIMLVSAININFGQVKNTKFNVYSIEFDYYGVDSSKIEQLITIPLESKINELPGLKELKSSSEYSKSYVTAYFDKKQKNKQIYLAIRNIVDTLYSELPTDVQKPRIFSSTVNDKSILTIAFTGSQNINSIRDWVNQNLKKKFESIDGVSEVMVTGGSQKEILVAFDTEKTVSAGQNPAGYSSIVQDANSVSPTSILRNKNGNSYIVFDTKLNTLDELRDLPVKIDEVYTELGYLANINESYRTRDEYVRLNGKECICVNIKSAFNGNSIYISRECNKILKGCNNFDLNIDVLHDNGKEQKKMLMSVFIAFIQSFIFVLLIIPLFYKDIKVTIMVMILMILDILWTFGILQLLHMSINPNTLAGITIALGLIADPVLLLGETAEKAESEEIFFVQISKIVISIIAASLTTILVIIPLFFMDSIIPGIKMLAITMLVMIVNSIILTVIFLPSYMYNNNSKRIFSNELSRKVFRFIYKSGYYFNASAGTKNKFSKILYLILMILPVFLFFVSGKNITLENQTDIVYCSVDYEPEIQAKYINDSLTEFIEQVLKNPHVKYVRTESRKGAADIDIGFFNDKTNYKTVAAELETCSNLITEGYLYIPGATQKKSRKHFELQLAIIGDENIRCREYAKEAAKLLQKTGIVDSAVLNFKRAEKQITFTPDKDKVHLNGLSVEGLSNSLRWFMFGPVADKWLQNGTEEDIRIAGKGLQSAPLEKITDIQIPTNDSYLKLTALGKITDNFSSGKLYRKDGRHAAYFTVEVNNISTDKAIKKIKEVLTFIKFDKGYAVSFPYEIIQLKRNYNILILAFILCVTGIFILMTILTENFLKSLLLISIIPVSCVLPMFLRVVTNTSLVLGDIIALVLLSGISVNNSIYIGESPSKKTIYKLRDKIKSITVTSLTTIFGCLPLYFFSQDVFSKSLAFFMFFGVLNSLLIVIMLYPKIYK